MMAIIWAIWSERNQRIFEVVRGLEVGRCGRRSAIGVVLWAYVSREFTNTSISDIVLHWKAAVSWFAKLVVT